ncbi:RsiV family protein [uncultured Proteiniphilum sp.]|uniref:RsiV family protein n=1 Tax=uncultured Proteiniphilum sp. TaxID=497637 RepID=UPI002623159D|nr:RsiV family protein [uncultured Proteiniphilum sp.]
MEVYHRMPVFILSLIVLLSFISCNHQGGRSMFRAENSVGFDTVSMVERHHLDGDTANPHCDIRVEFVYPVSSNKMSVDMLQQFFIRNVFGVPYDTLAPSAAVQAYVLNYIGNYTADAKTYRESADEIRELNNLIAGIDVSDSEHYTEDFFYSYYESLCDSIVYNRHGVLAFQVKQSNNKGGAASYDSFRNYVWNLNTGRQVTENDIFNAGYDTALQRIIITSLLEQADVKSVDELEDLGFFGVREIMPNHNFLLNDKGIIYTYNKGEYSAYQLDAPQVFIPYEAILSLLRENSVASKLANL